MFPFTLRPQLDSELVADMVANPYKTTSDSYYFVQKDGDWELIMHNKALYRYYSDGTQQSLSSCVVCLCFALL